MDCLGKRVFPMAGPSPLTAAQGLQKQVQSLLERFAALAASAQDQVVAPLARGEPPDQRTVEAIGAALADYQAAAGGAAGLGLTGQAPPDLRTLLGRLNQVIECESWEA